MITERLCRTKERAAVVFTEHLHPLCACVSQLLQVPYTMVSIYMYHTPVGRFPKLDCLLCDQEGAVPIPNDTPSQSSPRHAANADLFSNGTIPTVDISSMENRPTGGCDIYMHRPIRYSRAHPRVLRVSHAIVVVLFRHLFFVESKTGHNN